jgi:hypothetical protein
LSSAILYLAIVAIWACVLVPRWLHRSHDATPGPEVLIAQEEAPEGSDHAEFGPPGDASGDAAYLDSDPADPTTYIDPALADSAAETEPSVYSSVEVRYDYEVRSDYAVRSEVAAPADARSEPGRARERPPGPAASRAHVLQARRRMLTMLVALAVAATMCVLTGLTRWWTAIPPVGMLVMYLLVLREAAHTDADAIRRAEARARAHAARMARDRAGVAHERAREAQTLARETQSPQPAAEIIDISGRTAGMVDQLYDQYADAAVRAVGD